MVALGAKSLVVLSNNLIEEIEGISKLAELKKLSLSSNKIKTIPDLSSLSHSVRSIAALVF